MAQKLQQTLNLSHTNFHSLTISFFEIIELNAYLSRLDSGLTYWLNRDFKVPQLLNSLTFKANILGKFIAHETQ